MYQSTIMCICGEDVHCYGCFEFSVGICEKCGSAHYAEQIKIDSGHRYETSAKYTVRGRWLCFLWWLHEFVLEWKKVRKAR